MCRDASHLRWLSCVLRSLPVSPASSWEPTLFSWSVSPGHIHLILFIDSKTSVSDLSFYFYLQSLNHHGSCSFCSFRSWPVRSPRLLPIFSVTLIRFTASMLITLIRNALVLWLFGVFPLFPSLNDASTKQVPLPCGEMGILLGVRTGTVGWAEELSGETEGTG